MRFRTTIELGGKTATGFQVPDEVVAALRSGKRPAVLVSLGGHTYQTTVVSIGGRFLVPLSAENRAAAGVSARTVAPAAPRAWNGSTVADHLRFDARGAA